MIRITTKRIEKVHRTFVTLIPIRTVSVQAYSHSSQVSHNTHVQTIWNCFYIHTSTAEFPPKGLKRCSEHLWPQSRFVQFLFRRIAIFPRYPTIHMKKTIWNWLYVRTSSVHNGNGIQIDQISGWNFCDININSYSRCTCVQTWLNASPYKMNGPIHS